MAGKQAQRCARVLGIALLSCLTFLAGSALAHSAIVQGVIAQGTTGNSTSPYYCVVRSSYSEHLSSSILRLRAATSYREGPYYANGNHLTCNNNNIKGVPANWLGVELALSCNGSLYYSTGWSYNASGAYAIERSADATPSNCGGSVAPVSNHSFIGSITSAIGNGHTWDGSKWV